LENFKGCYARLQVLLIEMMILRNELRNECDVESMVFVEDAEAAFLNAILHAASLIFYS